MTLLAYVLVVLAVLTLAPFRFAWPTQWVVSWWGDVGDLPNNILLFVPLGFIFGLLRQRTSKRAAVLRALLFAAVAGLAIETSQLFLEARLSSLLDVIGNVSGSVLGALMCAALRVQMDRRMPGVLTLDLPLINLLYLLLPLMWLAGTGIGADRLRLWVLLPLAVTGALTLAGLWRFRLQRALRSPRLQLLLIVSAWFIAGAIVGLGIAPGTVAICATAVLLIGVAMPCLRGPYSGGERRFEARILATLWPWYLAYLLMITLDFPPRLQAPFDIVWIYPQYGFQRDFALRVVEQLGALTVLGYLIGETFGRSNAPARRVLLRNLVLGAVAVVLIEVAHGFRPDERASVLRGVLGLASVWCGTFLYAAQLDFVQLLIHPQRMSQPTAGVRI
ncbi:MAG: VanZ family protein [Gammaproteobacteria bacterium]|nr:VanZ family protein [Gammaproteobacteria bacterium]MBP6050218.1 VanZ family protein [Pseudomonadales bacterium]MBK6583861.1 VanZ family protein [Gammaproteobacteria bacterium]MBK7169763.1 VanZ family protein [Gammaproteobacteria bacterium]MBK7522198.1 VanZ family protein [Gammaproteobacteria bacterium]